MIKRTVEYENYDGVMVKEDFYFNLTQTELTMMEMEEDGGLSQRLQIMIDKKDGKQIMATFHDLMMRAYGEKTPDGRRFQKSPEISKAFSETPAFDIIFSELVMNPEAGLAFVDGLIPKELKQKLNAEKRPDATA